MKPKAYIFLVLLVAMCGTALAQGPGDPIAENLFPPELVMQHQQALALTDEQKDFFKTELRKAQLRFTELQWLLQDEAEKLAGLTKQEHVDEQAVLSQMDKVLAAEREIKRTQISLIIRIKNKLTPEQQTRLQEMKKKPRER